MKFNQQLCQKENKENTEFSFKHSQHYCESMKNLAVYTNRELRGNLLKEYLKQQTFTPLQKSVLIGLLLGDGTLSKNAESGHSNLKIEQATTPKGIAYVQFLYTIFKPWVGTPPKIRYHNGKPKSIWFCTFRMKELEFYREQFYTINANGQRKKCIPKLIHRWLDPISLAIWYMDDGGKKTYAYYLHSQGFTLKENKVLQKALQNVFKLNVTIHKQTAIIYEELEKQNLDRSIEKKEDLSGLLSPRREAKYFFLCIPAASRAQFAKIVKPYILPEFQYKFYPTDFLQK